VVLVSEKVNSKKENFSLNKKELDYCVGLARKSIEFSLKNDSLLKYTDFELLNFSKKLLEKKACFVTLQKNGELRGCIGHLVAIQPLYKDIIENAFNAAFSDPRFGALRKEELLSISIEVSILTDPVPLVFKDEKDLLSKITPKKDGLIINKGYYTATFLPSVWSEIKNKKIFLTQLCLKAGLDANEWKRPGLKVQIYHAIKAKE